MKPLETVHYRGLGLWRASLRRPGKSTLHAYDRTLYDAIQRLKRIARKERRP